MRKSRRKKATRNVISFYIRNYIFGESVCKTKICRRGNSGFQKTRRVPRVRGRGLRRANLRGARIFFLAYWEEDPERFWLNNCSGCIQQMYNRASAEKHRSRQANLGHSQAMQNQTKQASPGQGRQGQGKPHFFSFEMRRPP